MKGGREGGREGRRGRREDRRRGGRAWMYFVAAWNRKLSYFFPISILIFSPFL